MSDVSRMDKDLSEKFHKDLDALIQRHMNLWQGLPEVNMPYLVLGLGADTSMASVAVFKIIGEAEGDMDNAIKTMGTVFASAMNEHDMFPAHMKARLVAAGVKF